MNTAKPILPLIGVCVALLAACSGPQQTSTTTTAQPEQAAAEPTLVRFVHAIPDGPTVDALVGDTTVAQGVGYKGWGDWTSVPSGDQDVLIRNGESVELTDTYHFEPNQHYWIFAYGMMNPRGNELAASFIIAPEERLPDRPDETWMRFVNAASEGEAYGFVTTTGGSWTLLFPNQPLGTVSEFKLGPIEQNSFSVIPGRDTSLPAVIQFDRNIQVNMMYTFVVVGRASNHTLELIGIADSAMR